LHLISPRWICLSVPRVIRQVKVSS
jgi:hypothetical protein